LVSEVASFFIEGIPQSARRILVVFNLYFLAINNPVRAIGFISGAYLGDIFKRQQIV
jgi:hypothetical protein